MAGGVGQRGRRGDDPGRRTAAEAGSVSAVFRLEPQAQSARACTLVTLMGWDSESELGELDSRRNGGEEDEVEEGRGAASPIEEDPSKVATKTKTTPAGRRATQSVDAEGPPTSSTRLSDLEDGDDGLAASHISAQTLQREPCCAETAEQREERSKQVGLRKRRGVPCRTASGGILHSVGPLQRHAKRPVPSRVNKTRRASAGS